MPPDNPFPRLSERRPGDLTPLLGKFPPVADFVATNLGGRTVQFTDQSTDVDGEIVDWKWEFGDEIARPVASFSYLPSGLTVQFTDQSTDKPPGTVTGWSWMFGDGTTSSEQHPLHTYAAAGSYNVALTATDNEGNASALPYQRTVFLGGTTGLPFGPQGGLNSNSLEPNMDPFNFEMNFTWPEDIISKLNFCRTHNLKWLSQMADGAHDRYLTNGLFDFAKWQAEMNRLNTAAIRAAVASAVADGVLVGNSVMDEPNHHTWNGGSFSSPWMHKTPVAGSPGRSVDEMVRYVKGIFPTLPCGVMAIHTWRPEEHYQDCDFIISQYSNNKGSVTAFRDAALAVAAADGVALCFSINIIDGGIAGSTCPLDTTGGVGSSAGRCRVTPAQLESWGTVLGPAGCGLLMWRYDLAFMADAGNRTAFFNLRSLMDGQPAKSWRRGT